MKILRKGLYLAGLCGAVLVGAMFGGGGLGANANPGSPDDPLVTRSYVAQAIQQAMAGQGGETAEAFIFTPVQVLAGHVILGGEGTEMILRAGTATAHVPGPDGIVNTTAGADLFHAHPVVLNHYLIIPREDGRGIRAVTDTWFLVKGDFEIVFIP
ncbi:MAG: hypothetical protein FWC67_01115 [Defluviitaleaceae bacterium]|nr:hypothetical protein [Defluviitaleaceae bacterium]